jgi:hypothetical protein
MLADSMHQTVPADHHNRSHPQVTLLGDGDRESRLGGTAGLGLDLGIPDRGG